MAIIYKQIDRTAENVNTALDRTDLIPDMQDKIGHTYQMGTGNTSGYTLSDNDTYQWGSVPYLDISNLENSNGTYLVIFDSPSPQATTLVIPSYMLWEDNLVVEPNHRYYIGFINGAAFWHEFELPTE